MKLATRLWKALQVGLVIVASIAWLTSTFLWTYYDWTRSHTRDPAAGRIYRLETHGSIAYLTVAEQVIVYALMSTGVISFVAAVAIDIFVFKEPFRKR